MGNMIPNRGILVHPIFGFANPHGSNSQQCLTVLNGFHFWFQFVGFGVVHCLVATPESQKPERNPGTPSAGCKAGVVGIITNLEDF